MGLPPAEPEDGNDNGPQPNMINKATSSQSEVGFRFSLTEQMADIKNDANALQGLNSEAAGSSRGSYSDTPTGRDKTRMSTSKVFANETIFARIALSEPFQNFTLVVIVLNALWIFIDCEWNHKVLKDSDGNFKLDPAATVVENIFCFYFTFEVLVRFLAFRKKIDCCKDAWFVFDSCLVTCMILETWVVAIIELIQGGEGGGSVFANFSAFRLLRLLRLTRMARLMRSVPELMTLVKGMGAAFMAVFWMLLLLALVLYVFAIIFTSVVGDPDKKEPEIETAQHMFGTIGDSMMSLYTHGVLGDNLSFCFQAIMAFEGDPLFGFLPANYVLFWLFFVFFFISSMTLLNMLLGVLCEVITQTAATEKEKGAVRDLSFCIEDAFTIIDLNEDGKVCETEWAEIKNNKNVRHQLTALGVEHAYLDERLEQMQATIFGPKKRPSGSLGSGGINAAKDNEQREDGLSLEELITKVIEARPDRPATALELEMLKKKVNIGEKRMDKACNSIVRHLGGMQGTQLLATAPQPAPAGCTPATQPQVVPRRPNTNARDIPTRLLFHELARRAQNQKIVKAPGKGDLTCQDIKQEASADTLPPPPIGAS